MELATSKAPVRMQLFRAEYRSHVWQSSSSCNPGCKFQLSTFLNSFSKSNMWTTSLATNFKCKKELNLSKSHIKRNQSSDYLSPETPKNQTKETKYHIWVRFMSLADKMSEKQKFLVLLSDIEGKHLSMSPRHIKVFLLNRLLDREKTIVCRGEDFFYIILLDDEIVIQSRWSGPY